MKSSEHIKQQEPRGTRLSQSRVISSCSRSLAGIYINYKENLMLRLVMELCAVHFPSACSQVERKIKIRLNAVCAAGFRKL